MNFCLMRRTTEEVSILIMRNNTSVHTIWENFMDLTRITARKIIEVDTI